MTTTTKFDPKRLAPEERARIKAAKDALTAAAKDNWHDPAWRREMAAAMTEEVYLGFEHENILDYLTTVDNVGFDDQMYIRETKGLRAFMVARGGYIEASTLQSDVVTMPRRTIGFHVKEYEDKLLTNFAETQATLIDLGIQRMSAQINSWFLRLMQAAVPVGNAQYISGSGLSLTAVNAAIREIQDETRDGEVTIIGRQLMIGQIIDGLINNGSFSGFLPTTNEEIRRTGMMGEYKGASLVTIKNFRDDLDVPFWPGNELWVIGKDASKVGFYGGMKTKEFDEDDNWYWHYLARRDFGGALYRPSRVRRIVDTAISPYVVVEQ